MRRHAATTLTADVTTRVAVLVLAVVTARTLSPLDVGTLGLSVLLVGLVSMVSSFPESAAVIVRAQADDSDRAFAGFVCRLGLTAGLTVLTVSSLDAAAPFLAGSDVGAAKIRELTRLLLWLPWIESVASFPRIVLRRRLDLTYVAAMQLGGSLLYAALAIALLLRGLGAASLVWGQLVGTSAVAAFAWHRVAPSLKGGKLPKPAAATWVALRAETGRLVAGGIGGYISERLDNVLVASSLGAANTSFYAVAWNLTRIPVNTLSQVVQGVVVPSLAVGHSSQERRERTLRDTLRYTALAMAFSTVAILQFGSVLVVGLLGEKWRPLVPGLQVMAFTILNAPVQYAAGAQLVTSQRGHLVGLANAGQILAQLLLVPTLCAAAGVRGAAYADLLTTTLVTVLLLAGLVGTSGRPRWFRISSFAIPVTGALLATAVTAYLLPSSRSSAAAALAATALSSLLYLLLLTGTGYFGHPKNAIRSVLARYRGRHPASGAGGAEVPVGQDTTTHPS